MNSFIPNYLDQMRFHPSTTWFLSQCGEAKGMQEMWKKIRPEILKKLKESAIIQSTESSNRIEGVEVNRDRLIPLVIGRSKPRDRSEEEIVGYRKALSFIHQNHSKIAISPETIKTLHKLAQGGMVSDAGVWKTKNNDIIEIDHFGERRVRFSPVSFEKTPKFIEQLCLGYQDVSTHSKLPELIAIANFIFDFLCIHPFRDGNGRVSRLLTLLLLYQNGFEVGRFISLERIIENTKEDYYKVLYQSSINWHEQDHDLMPWWNYFLGTIKSGYQELKERVELSSGGDTKISLIKQTIISFEIPFSLADILKLHPSLNRDIIKKALASTKEEGKIKLIGKGRGAKWLVVKR